MYCDEGSGETVQMCRLARAFTTYINCANIAIRTVIYTMTKALAILCKWADLPERPLLTQMRQDRHLSQNMRLDTCTVTKPQARLSDCADWLKPMHAGGSDFRLSDGSDLKTYLLMRWKGPRCFGSCHAHRCLPVGFLCSGIHFYLLLSPYLCFISF